MPTNRKYRQVSLPIPMLERIETYQSEHPEEGFVNVPEFVRQAIRDKLENDSKTIE